MPGAYYMPPVNLIERGALSRIGEWAGNLGGKKALIVAAEGDFGRSQGEMVLAFLRKDGLDGEVFAGAGPNPTDLMVEAGLDAFRRCGCNLIVAVGGGSSMDCAKAIGLVAANGGKIADYDGVNRARRDLPPLIAVNTTAGTGSEVTGVAVITDTRREAKMTIIDWRITPRVSVNDPELMVSMPPSLTAATGFDALSHAVEACVSNASSPISNALAYQSISLVFKWLPRAVAEGSDMDAREGMCHAAFLAGLAFNNSALGLVHALSHPLSAHYHLPHGVVNAVLLPVVERYNLPVAMERFAVMARAMGVAVTWHSPGENAGKAIQAMETLRRQVGLPSGLGGLGVKEEDLVRLAGEAERERVAAGNPRGFSREVLVQLYRNAL